MGIFDRLFGRKETSSLSWGESNMLSWEAETSRALEASYIKTALIRDDEKEIYANRLIKLLEDESPRVRKAAAEAFKEHPSLSKIALKQLKRVASKDKDQDVQKVAKAALDNVNN